MGAIWTTVLGREYASAIDLLDEAIRECPDDLWGRSLWEVKRSDPYMWPQDAARTPGRTAQSIQVFSAFWYTAYHCLVHLDFSLSGARIDDFTPPVQFGGVDEHGVDESGAARLPRRVFAREELQAYVVRTRHRAAATFGALTDDRAEPRSSSLGGDSFAGTLLTNLLHTRTHGAELNLFLAQETRRLSAPK